MKNDTISRQAAIDAIEKHLNSVFDGTHYDEGIAYGYEAAHMHIQEVINELPSAQPKRNNGEWITSKMPITGAIENKCSECGTPFYMAFNLQMNFCPNCGADMRKGMNNNVE